MATETYKVIAQRNPAAATLEDMYTVPASTEAVISSIIIANRSNATRSFRVSIAVAGAVDSDEQYIAYDTSLPGNGIQELTIGATLGPGDVIRVQASAADLSFNVFGTEIA